MTSIVSRKAKVGPDISSYGRISGRDGGGGRYQPVQVAPKTASLLFSSWITSRIRHYTPSTKRRSSSETSRLVTLEDRRKAGGKPPRSARRKTWLANVVWEDTSALTRQDGKARVDGCGHRQASWLVETRAQTCGASSANARVQPTSPAKHTAQQLP